MKKPFSKLSFFFLSLILATGLFSDPAMADPVDFVKLSPQYYNVVLENEKVRVLEYRLKPGDKEQMHTHVRPGVIYFLTDSVIEIISPDGTRKTSKVKAGQTAWREPGTHAMNNIGNTELFGIAVEVKE